ncbi:unnamed protein product [Acanthosepion pharaonis]|uniref:Uncharacterized protein n=1 Tax=Acanthosepion pharaonis TaxID=158019 RepID=A0A812D1N7_ACAPH|nr:unnamed protein product [Sepia pharaonis]
MQKDFCFLFYKARREDINEQSKYLMRRSESTTQAHMHKKLVLNRWTGWAAEFDTFLFFSTPLFLSLLLSFSSHDYIILSHTVIYFSLFSDFFLTLYQRLFPLPVLSFKRNTFSLFLLFFPLFSLHRTHHLTKIETVTAFSCMNRHTYIPETSRRFLTGLGGAGSPVKSTKPSSCRDQQSPAPLRRSTDVPRLFQHPLTTLSSAH